MHAQATPKTSALPQSPAWQALADHAKVIKTQRIADYFSQDPIRAQQFAAEAAGVYLDYSRQAVTPQTLDLLLALADQQGLGNWIARLFAGEPVNHTEGRAAYHMALRAPATARMCVAGEDVVPEVHAVRERMAHFAKAVRKGEWLGATGERITDIVNIGIGGSDLGPRMVCEALKPYIDGPRVHYVANVDGAHLHRELKRLQPARTLFIITSKTFTTQETMANADVARQWLVAALGNDAVAQHFVAVSTNHSAVAAFGIAASSVFGFWDWVGGRYSLWSAVGLSTLIALGPERFAALLDGAYAMDQHFATAPLAQNLPVLMGLLTVWNTNFLGASSQVLAPYAQYLERFCGWAQQLEMESNGKRVNRAGETLPYATTPVLWGDVGTNSQHAFFQMLHQGPTVHPVDFVLVAQPSHPYTSLHKLLIANGLAQAKALMVGKDAATVRAELAAKGLQGEALEAAVPHRVFPGNRPSNTLLIPRLDAYHLGALCALYEHRCFVQSVLWEVNAFDQWGVELGKQLAQQVLAGMDGECSHLDGSTRALLARLS